MDKTTKLSRELRRAADELAAGRTNPFGTGEVLYNAAEELERLQHIIDNRPAINDALPESYIGWSQGIYHADAGQVHGTN